MASTTELMIGSTLRPETIKIPPYRRKLLIFSCDKPRFHRWPLSASDPEQRVLGLNEDNPDDPSTIYSMLPVKVPKKIENVPELGYWPSYSGMLPEQRGIYLLWLHDITASIEMSYVFVYYYGLERHLVYGDFDAAFKEILLLRQHHKSQSFQRYSGAALLHACFLRKRPEKLQELYGTGFDYFGNTNLLILYHCGLDMLPDMMLILANSLPTVSRQYVKAWPLIYKQKISELLIEQYGKPTFPLSSEFPLTGVWCEKCAMFANYSLHPDIQHPRLPNLFQDRFFRSKMRTFFKAVDKAVEKVLQKRIES